MKSNRFEKSVARVIVLRFFSLTVIMSSIVGCTKGDDDPNVHACMVNNVLFHYTLTDDGNATIGSDSSLGVVAVFAKGRISEYDDPCKSIKTAERSNWNHDSAIDKTVSGNLTIPDSLDGHPVVAIGASAFRGCTQMTTITLPEGTVAIDARAFEGCTGLRAVNIPDSVRRIEDDAFKGCTSLTSLQIPDRVSYIASGMFADCLNLAEVKFPSGIKYVDSSAFRGTEMVRNAADGIAVCCGWIVGLNEKCPADVTFPKEVRGIATGVFTGCVNLVSIVIPDGCARCLEYDRYVFKGCKNLTSVKLPSELSYIEAGTFADCPKLTSITIPEKVSGIGHDAFKGTGLVENATNGVAICSGWVVGVNDKCPEEVVLADEIRGVAARGFSGNANLVSVVLPRTSSSEDKDVGSGRRSQPKFELGYEAFKDCERLISVTHVPKNLVLSANMFKGTAIVKNAPNGVAIYNDWVVGTNDKCPANVVLPERARYIAECAFYGCSNLVSVTIPDSVCLIGERAFAYCAGLTSVVLPKKIQSVGMFTFKGCTNLKTVTIPAGVQVIERYAFKDCRKLECLIFEGKPPAIMKCKLPDGLKIRCRSEYSQEWEKMMMRRWSNMKLEIGL